MKYFFTYKKTGKDEARVSTYETRDEAYAYWLELQKQPNIDIYSHVDFGVDDQHCVAKSLMFWVDKGYYKPEQIHKPKYDTTKSIYLPNRK